MCFGILALFRTERHVSDDAPSWAYSFFMYSVRACARALSECMIGECAPFHALDGPTARIAQGKTRNMKKTTAFLGRLLALSILAVPFAVRADGFLDDDLYYQFESGSETRVYVYSLRNTSATHITIPSTVVY